MDDYLFRQYVQECRVVQEETKYLEIFNYSVGGGLFSSHQPRRLTKTTNNESSFRIRFIILARSIFSRQMNLKISFIDGYVFHPSHLPQDGCANPGRGRLRRQIYVWERRS